MRLFRFHGVDKFERDFDFIESSKFWSSRIEDLNDPSEAFIDLKELGQVSNLYLRFFKPFRKNKKELVQDLVDAIQNAINIKKEGGVYCLSKTVSNELMWAHYASGHKGYCLEYDSSNLRVINPNDIGFSLHSKLIDIKYSDKIQSLKIDSARDANSIAETIFSNKSNSWKYEQESRIITQMAGEHNYNKESLKAIHFGLRVDEKIVLKMTNNLDLDFYRIERLENSYTLESKKIE